MKETIVTKRYVLFSLLKGSFTNFWIRVVKSLELLYSFLSNDSHDNLIFSLGNKTKGIHNNKTKTYIRRQQAGYEFTLLGPFHKLLLRNLELSFTFILFLDNQELDKREAIQIQRTLNSFMDFCNCNPHQLLPN